MVDVTKIAPMTKGQQREVGAFWWADGGAASYALEAFFRFLGFEGVSVPGLISALSETPSSNAGTAPEGKLAANAAPLVSGAWAIESIAKRHPIDEWSISSSATARRMCRGI